MKKWKRWMAFVVSVAFCLSLSGCSQLDDMQAAHGIWTDTNTIDWNGYTYTLLEGYWTDLNVDQERYIYVTEADVPVLLSAIYGEHISVNTGATLLSYYEYESISGSSGERVFCRSDLLDWLNDAFINGYAIESYRYDYWDDGAYENDTYTLTAEQTQAVNTVLTTVDSFTVAEYITTEDGIALYGLSQYNLFIEDIGWVDYIDGYYYIFRDNDHDGYEWNYDCYIVPEDLYSIFDSIMVAKTQSNLTANPSPTTVYPPAIFTDV